MKKKITILVFLFYIVANYAQQDSQFTQYMYNTININPAYAASRGVTSVFLLNRTQWVGLDGSPSTNVFSISAPFKDGKLGLGVSILNDRIGPSDENNIAVDFAYTIKTSDTYNLAFGLKASLNLLNVDFTKLSQFNTGDNAFNQNIDNNFSPNVGAGIYFYSDRTYFGVSVPQILETKYYDKYANVGAISTASERASIYLMAGQVFDFSKDVKFKPSVLSKIVSGAPIQFDISGNMLFHEKFTLGLAYRWDVAVSALAGFQISDSWFIGYGYDMSTTQLTNYSNGTHEVFLRFELFKKYSRLISPRFF